MSFVAQNQMILGGYPPIPTHSLRRKADAPRSPTTGLRARFVGFTSTSTPLIRWDRISLSCKPGTAPCSPGIGSVGRNSEFDFGAGFHVAPEFKIATDGFGAFPHASQTVMPRASLLRHDICIHAPPIIANAQTQLLHFMVNLHFDVLRLSVTEGVAQSLGGNAVNLVAQNGVEIAGHAFHLHVNGVSTLVGFIGGEFSCESCERRSEIVGLDVKMRLASLMKR
jgi:hypothetical protein